MSGVTNSHFARSDTRHREWQHRLARLELFIVP
jgi:hypothetical protein